MGAAWVSMELGTRGPLSSQCTACAASNMAIGEGADMIRLGRADAVFAGGAEGGSTPGGVGGFRALRARAPGDEGRGRGGSPVGAGGRAGAAERGAGAGEPPVRRGAQRVRDGRGGWRDRARGARACACPRGQDLRGAARLRTVI